MKRTAGRRKMNFDNNPSSTAQALPMTMKERNSLSSQAPLEPDTDTGVQDENMEHLARDSNCREEARAGSNVKTRSYQMSSEKFQPENEKCREERMLKHGSSNAPSRPKLSRRTIDGTCHRNHPKNHRGLGTHLSNYLIKRGSRLELA